MAAITLNSVLIENGETIGYRERDGGEFPLLLIHGNMNSSKHWDLVIEQADPKLKIIAMDLRGFGISSYHQQINEIKDFSEDVKKFVDAIGWKRFDMMGWSMGGCVSMQFAADYPAYVNKLLLLASGSTRGYPIYAVDEGGKWTQRLKTKQQVEQYDKTKLVLSAYERRDKLFLRAMFNRAIYTRNQPTEERYEEYLDDILTQRNLSDVYHALNVFNMSKYDHEAGKGTGEASRIKAPTLVLWGNNDLVVTEQMTNEIVEDMEENATLSALENCGHSPLIDDLSLLLNKLHAFTLFS